MNVFKDVDTYSQVALPRTLPTLYYSYFFLFFKEQFQDLHDPKKVENHW